MIKPAKFKALLRRNLLSLSKGRDALCRPLTPAHKDNSASAIASAAMVAEGAPATPTATGEAKSS
jgi:hypothetical protein